MFLKNYYIALSYAAREVSEQYIEGNTPVHVGGNAVPAGTFGKAYENILFYARNIDRTKPSMSNVLYQLGTGTDGGGVAFGDGDTAPTLDDYTLSGSVVSGISVSPAVSREFADGKMVYKGVYTITNTSDTAKTIKEIGLFCTVTTEYPRYQMCVERTVLDEPVTIEAGGIGMVEYIIYVEIPTA